jgi:hypothetical protein
MRIIFIFKYIFLYQNKFNLKLKKIKNTIILQSQTTSKFGIMEWSCFSKKKINFFYFFLFLCMF